MRTRGLLAFLPILALLVVLSMGVSAASAVHVTPATTTDLTPSLLATAYNETGLLTKGYNGTNYTIAIIDPYVGLENQTQLTSDYRNFSIAYGLPTTGLEFAYVGMHGNYNRSNVNPGWQLEDVLDIEYAHATAPGAKILMAFSPDDGYGLYVTLGWVVNNSKANVTSMSWGEDVKDAETDGSFVATNATLDNAAETNITVLAATGDCGSYNGGNSTSVMYPAASPLVTAVGGTTLIVTSEGVREYEGAWNNTGQYPCSNTGGGGGGPTPFPTPSWQVIPSSVLLNRSVPDVSAVAQPGAYISTGGTLYAVGGTSLACPVWAGFVATIDSYIGHPIGFLNPHLYAVLNEAKNYTRDFYQITDGNNGYPAAAGWNYDGGVGTPNVDALAITLNGSGYIAPTPLPIPAILTPMETTAIEVAGGAGAVAIFGYIVWYTSTNTTRRRKY